MGPGLSVAGVGSQGPPSRAAKLQKLQESGHDDKPRRQVTGPQSPRCQLGILPSVGAHRRS